MFLRVTSLECQSDINTLCNISAYLRTSGSLLYKRNMEFKGDQGKESIIFVGVDRKICPLDHSLTSPSKLVMPKMDFWDYFFHHPRLSPHTDDRLL